MKVRGYCGWAPLLGLAALASCKNTWLLLHVRAPGDDELSNTEVRLIMAEEPICGGGLLYFGRTDPAGKLRIHTPACGEMRLVVTRPGRSTYLREIDTCELDNLDVTLSAVQPARGASGSCEAVASAFMSAWLAGDNQRARTFWLTPDAYDPFVRSPPSEEPWAIDMGPGEVDGRTCVVMTTEFTLTGCDFLWQLDLEQSDERGWGLRALRQRRLPQ